MKTNRMTIVEKTHERLHRSPIIIRDTDSLYICAEFDSVEQLDFLAQTVGFTYTAESWMDTEYCGIWREYRLSHRIERDYFGGFWSLDEIPEGAKPIKALSNGSIVTCYFTNDGETIRFYRPNPNAKQVYHPLTVEEHIAHRRIYGSY